ncbi:MAG TPA: hypothetical protein VMW17_19370 [Candidatus Binatia bacterium]|nr:hypothetical protein [Candidatus Binatia bacterium]
MKKMVVALLFGFAIAMASPVHAEMSPTTEPDEYDDMQSHPLRIAAYFAHPIGFTLEWLVFRPFHMLVSQPTLAPFFGHTPHSDEASALYR